MANQEPAVRVGIRELRQNLSAYLRQAQGGASVYITSHDKVIAELRPPSVDQRPPRQLATLRGRIKIAPDFDETPADLIDAMEGEA